MLSLRKTKRKNKTTPRSGEEEDQGIFGDGNTPDGIAIASGLYAIAESIDALAQAVNNLAGGESDDILDGDITGQYMDGKNID